MPINPNSPFGQALGNLIDDLQGYEDNRNEMYAQLSSVQSSILFLNEQKNQLENQIGVFNKNIKSKYEELASIVQYRGPMNGSG